MQGGQLSKLSKQKLGEELFLESEQIIRWATSQQTKQKLAEKRAFARRGKANYEDLTTAQLNKELSKRGIDPKRKKDPGKRKLLEEDDDRCQKLTKRRRSGSGSAAGGGSRKPKKPRQKENRKGKRKAGGRQKPGGTSAKKQRQQRQRS